jgi:hypothetical protein
MILTKLYSGEHHKETPGTHDLEVINRYALEPGSLTADDVFVGRVRLCNDQYDKAHERFPLPVLERFAETAPGKPVLRGHNQRQEPAGRFFDAETVKDAAGVTHVVARYYLSANDPLTSKVKAGIVRDVSIGAAAVQRTCDLCGEDFDSDACKHMPGVEYEGKPCTITYSGDPSGYETKEGSFVVEGCQWGAETIRSFETLTAEKAARLTETTGTKAEGDPMPPEVTPAAAAPDGLTAEKAALLNTELGELKKWKAESEPLVADGKAYREFLLAEIKRKYSVCEMEQTGIAIANSLAGATAETLKAAESEASKLMNQRLGGKGDGVPADPKHDTTPTAPEPFDPFRPFRVGARRAS